MAAFSPVQEGVPVADGLMTAAISSASSITTQAAGEIGKQVMARMSDTEKAALALKIAQELSGPARR